MQLQYNPTKTQSSFLKFIAFIMANIFWPFAEKMVLIYEIKAVLTNLQQTKTSIAARQRKTNLFVFVQKKKISSILLPKWNPLAKNNAFTNMMACSNDMFSMKQPMLNNMFWVRKKSFGFLVIR